MTSVLLRPTNIPFLYRSLTPRWGGGGSAYHQNPQKISQLYGSWSLHYCPILGLPKCERVLIISFHYCCLYNLKLLWNFSDREGKRRKGISIIKQSTMLVLCKETILVKTFSQSINKRILSYLNHLHHSQGPNALINTK